MLYKDQTDYSVLVPGFIVLALIMIVSGCSSDSDSSSSDSDYGRFANDPSVDLKRRDVLPPEEPTPVEEVLSTFEVADGFRIELVASEPLVEDPVAMTVDEAGRVYVLELHGYPDDESGSSRIKLLTDIDAEGRPGGAQVFADGLGMPKGLMPWKNGILVTDAPDLIYLEDTDGDGRADHREVLLTGFNNHNPQLGINTPIYGLDNWIYIADFGGSEVHSPGSPDSTYRVQGNFRFRPDTGEIESLSARSQFGQAFNAWGDHFLVSNSNHLYQEVLAAPYLERNPDQRVGSTTEIIPDHGASAKVYPITPDPNNRLGNPGGITSASGLISYLGGAFPSEYDGVTFVGEPIYNVVHADRLSKSGATFTASRLQEQREFLASTDRWFRPVNFYIGPDGALYVLDYSRRIIEQPKFLTEEILNTANLYAGADRGRIYRIVPEESEATSWPDEVQLADASADELVAALEHSNIWWRRTAQRLLVDRQLQDAVEPLRRVAQDGSSAEARVHALWTLEGLGALETALITGALGDAAPGVRRNAVKLAELRLAEAQGEANASNSEAAGAADLTGKLMAMSEDPDPHVRFQLLSALGYLNGSQAQQVRQQMLFANLEDKWMQIAALSAADVEAMPLYQQAVADLAQEETEQRRGFFNRVSSLVGARGQLGDIRRVLGQTTNASEASWWRVASLEGLADGMQGQDITAASLGEEGEVLLERFFSTDVADVRSGYLDVMEVVGLPEGPSRDAVVKRAAATASDQGEEPELRADAVRVLALDDPTAHGDLLRSLIQPQEPALVQQAAVQVLGRIEDENVAEFLLSRWGAMTPEVRRQTIGVLLSDLGDKERVSLVLDAIESGRVRPSAVPRHIDERLVEHSDDEIRGHAEEVLRQAPGERQDVLADYQDALDMSGDADRGKQVFDRVCAQCHQVGGSGGTAIGPDLAALENRPPGWLMEAILIPNKAIADGYGLWTIERENGESAVGIIASETPASITVRNMGGEETVIPRSNIASMQEAESSLMPPGLESQMSKQDMADLISYLMSVQTVN